MSALGRAFEQASRLGHQWVGPEHVMLAILDGDDDHHAVIVEALGGLTMATYEDHYLHQLLHTTPAVRSSIERGRSARTAPVWHRLEGWVKGYAVAAGVPPGDAVVLLGLCALLTRSLAPGIERTRVAEFVTTSLGLPPIDPPSGDEALGERIDVPLDRLTDVRRVLLEADQLLGFNLDPENDQAWVVVKQADRPTLALVDAALAERP